MSDETHNFYCNAASGINWFLFYTQNFNKHARQKTGNTSKLLWLQSTKNSSTKIWSQKYAKPKKNSESWLLDQKMTKSHRWLKRSKHYVDWINQAVNQFTCWFRHFFCCLASMSMKRGFVNYLLQIFLSLPRYMTKVVQTGTVYHLANSSHTSLQSVG